MSIDNALIDYVFLGIEDHGCFAVSIGFDFGGEGQATGAINLGNPKFCLAYLKKILSAVGVDSFDKLKGRSVRVKREGGMVVGFGHFIKNEWCILDDVRREVGL